MIKKQLLEKYGEYLDQLDISETNTSLKLSMIKVKPEFRYDKNNQGNNLKIGSKVMSDLINYADTYKKIVTLTPDNIDGVSVNTLTQFYKKFGFKMNKGHNKNFEYNDLMIRYPKLPGMKENSKELIKNLLRESYKPKHVTQLIRECVLLLERAFNGLTGSQLTTKEIDDLYLIFKQSYMNSIGSAWPIEKFKSRVQDWLLFGNSDGFVTARLQRSGMLKLTGSAGNPKGILFGLNELMATNKAIWGVVTPDIAGMLQKKGFIIPNKLFMKIIFKLIPTNVLGPDVHVNSDGTLNVTSGDGSMNKIFVANKLYYKELLLNNEIGDKIPNIIKLWIKAL